MNRSESHRKYSINENYFDEIDTEEKAYFLGLLYADGYNNTDRGAVQLLLKKEDISILVKLNSSIGSNRPLQYRTYENPNHSDQYGLNISNQHISKKLSELGCTKKKSTTLIFPEWIAPNLIRHFIRGYFDGDGCIHVSKRTIVNLVGTKSFINRVQDILVAELALNKTKLQENKRGNSDIVTMQYSGSIQARKISNWLYKDSSIFLERKFNKFKSII